MELESTKNAIFEMSEIYIETYWLGQVKSLKNMKARNLAKIITHSIKYKT